MSCPNVWRCSFIVVQLNYMACIHLNFIKKNMWIYRPRGLGLSSHFHGLTEALCLPSILSAVLTTGSRVGLNESVCVCSVCSPLAKGYGLYKQGRGFMHGFFPDPFLYFGFYCWFLPICLLHTRRQVACASVCLCLTCRTAVQTAVSMARAASCRGKARLPVLRALLWRVCV